MDHAHRNSGSICDKITSHRRPSDLLGQLLRRRRREEKEKFRKFRTGLSRYYWVLLRCYNARVTSVEYNKVPEKAYVFTFAELLGFCASPSLLRASTDALIMSNNVAVQCDVDNPGLNPKCKGLV